MGLANKDLSFFTVESPDLELGEYLGGDVVSLEVVEEMDKLDSGSLQLIDPNNVYSRLLRVGAKLSITWGYIKGDLSPQSALGREFNVDEMTGSLERRGLLAFVTSPAGGGDQKGVMTYKCNFTALTQRGEEKRKVYRGGTKGGVIGEVMDELGIVQRDVRFSAASDPLSGGKELPRWESAFKFLSRLGRELRVSFKVGYTPDGSLAAMFVDPGLVVSSPFNGWVTGGSGTGNFFDYKGTVSNVISYDWVNHNGESGLGDNVQARFVDGQVQFFRYVAEDDRVVGWRLVPERLKVELERRGLEGGFEGKVAFVREYLGVESFEKVKRFFEPIESSTAPQGLGYTVNLRALGSPLHAVSNEASFGAGFPDQIGNANTKFYIRRVSHKIGIEGYFGGVQVVDAFRITPTGEGIL